MNIYRFVTFDCYNAEEIFPITVFMLLYFLVQQTYINMYQIIL